MQFLLNLGIIAEKNTACFMGYFRPEKIQTRTNTNKIKALHVPKEGIHP